MSARAPDVRSALKTMPRLYTLAIGDGLVGRLGRTFGHQRRDYKPKPPKLIMDRDDQLVFQHELLTTYTYKVQIEEEAGESHVILEVKTSSMAKESQSADEVTLLFYALTKALETGQWTQPA